MWYVQPAKDQSLCESLEYSMTVKLPTEHNLEFISLKGSFTGSSESTHVKIPHCWKSNVAARYIFLKHTCKLPPTEFTAAFDCRSF